MATAFVASHTVPKGGLDARATPDPAAPVAARLDPGLTVKVIDRVDDWAHIECSNGWQAWVDARYLVGATGTATTAARTDGLAIAGIGLASLIGMAAVIGGGFLDWWKVAGVSLTAWDIPMKFVLSGDVDDGLKVGPFLFVVVLLAIPLVTRRPLPAIATMAIAVVPIVLAGMTLIRGVREDPSIDPKLGMLLTFAGGVLILVDGLLAGVGGGPTDG